MRRRNVCRRGIQAGLKGCEVSWKRTSRTRMGRSEHTKNSSVSRSALEVNWELISIIGRLCLAPPRHPIHLCLLRCLGLELFYFSFRQRFDGHVGTRLFAERPELEVVRGVDGGGARDVVVEHVKELCFKQID